MFANRGKPQRAETSALNIGALRHQARHAARLEDRRAALAKLIELGEDPDRATPPSAA
jgi:hypothetical protein